MKKKIFVILFLIAIISISTSNIMANFEFTTNDVAHNLPDLPDRVINSNYFIVYSSDYGYSLFYSDSPYTYEAECDVFYNQYGADCIFIGERVSYYGYDDSKSNFAWTVKNTNNSELHIAGLNIGWYTMLYTNHNICDSNGNVIFSPSSNDDTIGEPNSRLALTYEYNEDYTECKINATIKDGAFTDKIYYSNYMPGVTGTLASKRGFPVERHNSH